MQFKMIGITATLCLLNVVAAAGETPATPACAEQPEIVSIAQQPGLAEIGESDAIPVYEVKYRHCEQTHRLLIQLPNDEAETGRTRFQPIFF